MSDTTIYTKPEKGKKWHIKYSPLWTLCYQFCAHWETTDNAPEPGEICQQCQAIAEAIRAGDAVLRGDMTTITELKRTIALLKTSTAPRAKETVKLCRANIRWLRQREKHNGSK